MLNMHYMLVLFCASFSYLLIIYKISISNRNWNPHIQSSLLLGIIMYSMEDGHTDSRDTPTCVA